MKNGLRFVADNARYAKLRRKVGKVNFHVRNLIGRGVANLCLLRPCADLLAHRARQEKIVCKMLVECFWIARNQADILALNVQTIARNECDATKQTWTLLSQRRYQIAPTHEESRIERLHKEFALCGFEFLETSFFLEVGKRKAQILPAIRIPCAGQRGTASNAQKFAEFVFDHFHWRCVT